MIDPGRFTATLDERGRLTLPRKIRNRLPPELWLLPGFDGCIFIVDSSRWQQVLAELSEISWNDPDGTDIQRFFAQAYTDTCDRQGRVSIPQHLLAHAGIEREVILLGALDRVEVWSPVRYATYAERALNDARIREIRERKLTARSQAGGSSR